MCFSGRRLVLKVIAQLVFDVSELEPLFSYLNLVPQMERHAVIVCSTIISSEHKQAPKWYWSTFIHYLKYTISHLFYGTNNKSINVPILPPQQMEFFLTMLRLSFLLPIPQIASPQFLFFSHWNFSGGLFLAISDLLSQEGHMLHVLHLW